MAEQLPPKSIEPNGASGATLSDGKLSYSFLLDPQKLQWSYQADYAANSVLETTNPDITWKSSVSTLSIPDVLFVTQGMSEDVSDKIKQLAVWCNTGVPLKFAFGGTIVSRCFIQKFSPVERQWRAGKCTQAEASLDLVIAREPVVITTATKDSKVAYTPRERDNLAKTVLDALKNPAKATKIKAKAGTQVSVAEDGYVTLRDSKGVLFGTYKVSDLRTQGIIK